MGQRLLVSDQGDSIVDPERVYYSAHIRRQADSCARVSRRQKLQ